MASNGGLRPAAVQTDGDVSSPVDEPPETTAAEVMVQISVTEVYYVAGTLTFLRADFGRLLTLHDLLPASISVEVANMLRTVLIPVRRDVYEGLASQITSEIVRARAQLGRAILLTVARVQIMWAFSVVGPQRNAGIPAAPAASASDAELPWPNVRITNELVWTHVYRSWPVRIDNENDDENDNEFDESDDDDENEFEVSAASIDEYGLGGGGGGFGGAPASASSIEKIDRLRYGDEDDEDDGGSCRACAICMDDFEEGTQLCKMPCSHAFHERCLVPWLERSRLCPLCRYSLS